MTQPSLYGEKQAVPYRKTSRTSRAAAEALSQSPAKRIAKRDRLLAAYVQAGARGLNDAEASEATSLPRSSICSLRGALIKAGWVMDGYTRRAGPYGHSQVVWTVTKRGREVAK